MGCFVWKVNPVIGNFGSLTIRWYGLFLSLSFLIGYFFVCWQFWRAGKVANLDDFLTFLRLLIYLVGGIALGAYLGDRIFYRWNSLWANPLSFLSLDSGLSGLSSHGAFLGALAAAYLFHLTSKIRFLEILDRLTFSGAAGIVLVRLGNLMNSEYVGRPTELPWAFCFPFRDGGLTPRHPAQIYEAGIGLILLLAMVMVDRKCGGEKRPLGLLTGILFLGYFTMRLIVEFFKEGEFFSPAFPFAIGQVLSLPLMLTGLCLTVWAIKKRLHVS